MSEEHEIYVNCTPYTWSNDPIPLKSNDVIQIGTEDFIFLLPVESKISKDDDDIQDLEEFKGQDIGIIEESGDEEKIITS